MTPWVHFHPIGSFIHDPEGKLPLIFMTQRVKIHGFTVTNWRQQKRGFVTTVTTPAGSMTHWVLGSIGFTGAGVPCARWVRLHHAPRFPLGVVPVIQEGHLGPGGSLGSRGRGRADDPPHLSTAAPRTIFYFFKIKNPMGSVYPIAPDKSP